MKLGNLEFLIKFVKDDETIETVSTPSMWALADEWVDSLIAKGEHTEAWCQRQLAGAIFLMAAQAEGLVPKGKITIPAIADVLSNLDPEIVDEPEGGENPTKTAQE